MSELTISLISFKWSENIGMILNYQPHASLHAVSFHDLVLLFGRRIPAQALRTPGAHRP